MARLEFINFNPWREATRHGSSLWVLDPLAVSVEKLPQIFWSTGEGWAEANVWALEKATTLQVNPKTVLSLMKHLRAYAEFLEERGLDWRHFPIRKADRTIFMFRGHLIKQIEDGGLKSSTANARMTALKQFYRFAHANALINSIVPMWAERSVVIPIFDSAGFQRSIARVSTELSIRNNARSFTRLEDGLLPLRVEDMTRLLDFSRGEGNEELHLMLLLGFFTGARLGTISTLRVENLDQGRPDPFAPGFTLIRVGPGTGVTTKFDVKGDLFVPDFLYGELRRFASSAERLMREAAAVESQKSFLFLTRRKRAYTVDSVGRLVIELRKRALGSGLGFMKEFKFHQTRATYGTWLMRLALKVTDAGAAIEFVRSAMLHKHESTTFRYVKFIEVTKGKEEVAVAFGQAFTGLKGRDWSRFNG